MKKYILLMLLSVASSQFIVTVDVDAAKEEAARQEKVKLEEARLKELEKAEKNRIAATESAKVAEAQKQSDIKNTTDVNSGVEVINPTHEINDGVDISTVTDSGEEVKLKTETVDNQSMLDSMYDSIKSFFKKSIQAFNDLISSFSRQSPAQMAKITEDTNNLITAIISRIFERNSSDSYNLKQEAEKASKDLKALNELKQKASDQKVLDEMSALVIDDLAELVAKRKQSAELSSDPSISKSLDFVLNDLDVAMKEKIIEIADGKVVSSRQTARIIDAINKLDIRVNDEGEYLIPENGKFITTEMRRVELSQKDLLAVKEALDARTNELTGNFARMNLEKVTSLEKFKANQSNGYTLNVIIDQINFSGEEYQDMNSDIFTQIIDSNLSQNDFNKIQEALKNQANKQNEDYTPLTYDEYLNVQGKVRTANMIDEIKESDEGYEDMYKSIHDQMISTHLTRENYDAIRNALIEKSAGFMNPISYDEFLMSQKPASELSSTSVSNDVFAVDKELDITPNVVAPIVPAITTSVVTGQTAAVISSANANVVNSVSAPAGSSSTGIATVNNVFNNSSSSVVSSDILSDSIAEVTPVNNNSAFLNDVNSGPVKIVDTSLVTSQEQNAIDIPKQAELDKVNLDKIEKDPIAEAQKQLDVQDMTNISSEQPSMILGEKAKQIIDSIQGVVSEGYTDFNQPEILDYIKNLMIDALRENKLSEQDYKNIEAELIKNGMEKPFDEYQDFVDKQIAQEKALKDQIEAEESALKEKQAAEKVLKEKQAAEAKALRDKIDAEHEKIYQEFDENDKNKVDNAVKNEDLKSYSSPDQYKNYLQEGRKFLSKIDHDRIKLDAKNKAIDEIIAKKKLVVEPMTAIDTNLSNQASLPNTTSNIFDVMPVDGSKLTTQEQNSMDTGVSSNLSPDEVSLKKSSSEVMQGPSVAQEIINSIRTLALEDGTDFNNNDFLEYLESLMIDAFHENKLSEQDYKKIKDELVKNGMTKPFDEYQDFVVKQTAEKALKDQADAQREAIYQENKKQIDEAMKRARDYAFKNKSQFLKEGQKFLRESDYKLIELDAKNKAIDEIITNNKLIQDGRSSPVGVDQLLMD